MLRHFEQSAWGANPPLAVLLAICLTGVAQAGGLAVSEGPAASQCGESEQGCTRIRGHIPAASEGSGAETIRARSTSLGPPPAPFVAGLDAAGRAAADAVNRLFFLQVSHDDGAR